ncbi:MULTISPECIES: hypothetical protein [Cryobacterium]|uniref:Uncharacterized protein n=1 Tax=Cryobacterium zongtaii TaxID=1259217 RepID=A0A2S3ZCF6_9MICO|nr:MULTISPECIES: hypothetical protein [Cryobacterium]POH63495.1 hypothetical protein C3B60_15310 [Cryobacterium zongtaii]POH63911.1 hypothetical protein C3B61_14080 [Cryobacterium zongtaii]TFC42169.1 hypothetical protein E3O57_16155 [Cryobacterium sp. TMN-39-2]
MAFGKFVDSLFKGPATTDAHSAAVEPAAVVESEDEATRRALDQLRAAVRSSGGELPTLLTSRLAQIDDLLRRVIEMVAAQNASTEQRVLLDAMIRDYLPTPLRAYLALPEAERTNTSAATLQFSAQLGILEETIGDLLNQIRIGAIAELSTHGRFLADKFAAPTLTLDGR